MVLGALVPVGANREGEAGGAGGAEDARKCAIRLRHEQLLAIEKKSSTNHREKM